MEDSGQTTSTKKNRPWLAGIACLASGLFLGWAIAYLLYESRNYLHVQISELRAIEMLQSNGGQLRNFSAVGVEVNGRVVDTQTIDPQSIFGGRDPDMLIESWSANGTQRVWASVDHWHGWLADQGESTDYVGQNVTLRCRGIHEGRLVGCHIAGHSFEFLRPLLK